VIHVIPRECRSSRAEQQYGAKNRDLLLNHVPLLLSNLGGLTSAKSEASVLQSDATQPE
jgi:hypothetical protein